MFGSSIDRIADDESNSPDILSPELGVLLENSLAKPRRRRCSIASVVIVLRMSHNPPFRCGRDDGTGFRIHSS